MTPFGWIGRFRPCRLAPDGTTMSVIRCIPFVNGEAARPSIAVFAPAPGARNRSS